MENAPEPHEQLDQFRERVTTARRRGDRKQKELAAALGFNDRVLSRKLNGKGRERLTTADVKAIIKILASWKAITSRMEAMELLSLMDLAADSFSSDDWQKLPLSALSVPERPFLPVPPTRLIGRKEEVKAVRDLILSAEIRLVTLTGPAGVGKTRLALQVASELVRQFPDGVFFVPLAPVSAPDRVLPAICQALGLSPAGRQSFQESLKGALHNEHALLLLDNFEQVAAAGVYIAELLEACPGLKLLISSREVLHVQAEWEFDVLPLALPDPKRLPPMKECLQYAAVELFAQRAKAVKRGFAVSGDTVAKVVAICERLDGLPLAIELTAARIKHFSLHALLIGLEQGLPTHANGARNLPERQRTMNNALAWSYDLLSGEEQALFRRLAVFVDGCALQAVEAVYLQASSLAGDLREMLASLVDKSLLRYQDVGEEQEPRFWMLHVLREFGLGRLARAGEAQVTREAHASYFLAQAEEADSHLQDVEHGEWLAWMDMEYENLRLALAWLLERANRGAEEAERAFRLCQALYLYWRRRGYYSEGRANLSRVLKYKTDVGPARLALALRSSGMLAYIQDDLTEAERLVQESLPLYRNLGDERNAAYALTILGYVAKRRCSHTVARTQFEEALALFQQMGDLWGRANTLVDLARLFSLQGQYDRALSRYEEALEISRTIGIRGDIGYKLYFLAEGLFLAGADLQRARLLAQESLELLREAGNKQQVAYACSLLSLIHQQEGDTIAARQLLEESAIILKEVGDRLGRANVLIDLAKMETSLDEFAAARARFRECLEIVTGGEFQELIAPLLEGIATFAVRREALETAALLWGAAEAQREATGIPLPTIYRVGYQEAVSRVRSSLEAKSFTAASARGRSLPPQQLLHDLPLFLAQ